MRLSARALLVAAGIGVLLSGCGFIRVEPREPWRAEAEAACMRAGIIKPSAFIRPTKAIEGPGPCGADLPLKVSGFQNDANAVALALASTGAPQSGFAQGQSGFAQGIVELTVLKPEVTMGCPMVAWTDDWVAGAVQPAAIAWFGQGVKEIRTAGAYACRRRNHQQNARLSEHAFGNAIDVMTFVMNDGYVVTVKGGWNGTEQEQGFLRDVFHGACQRFKTVLGPGVPLHHDHFHLDLAHHDARGQRRYCRPFVAAPQRPAPGQFAPGANPWGGPPNPYAFNQPNPPPQQQAAAPIYNRPPQPTGVPLPAPSSGMIAGHAPATPAASAPRAIWSERDLRDDFDVANDGNKEVEPEFDPKEFDIRTGSIPDLPRPRGTVSSPAPSGPAPMPEAEYVPAPAPVYRAPRRTVRTQPLRYDPAGK